MADVVVNITGDASGLQNTLDQFGQQNPHQLPLGGGNNGGFGGQTPQPPIPGGHSPLPQTPSGGTPAMPTYERMAQDIRREITNRGVMLVPGTANFNQFMNQVQQQQKSNAYRAIDAKYDDRFNQLQTRRKEEEDSLRKEIEEKRNAALAGKTSPLAIKNINDSFDASLSRRLNRLDSKYELEYQKLEKSSSSERASVDKELIKVIEDLTQELRQSGNGDSVLGKLRRQHQEALSRRDNAMTEEEVRKASRDAADIELRMSKALGNYDPMRMIGKQWGMFAGIGGVGLEGLRGFVRNTGSKIDILGTAASGDIFGAMQQELDRRKANWGTTGSVIGGTIGAVLGGFWNGGAGAAAGSAVGSGIVSWLTSAAFELFNSDEIYRTKFGSLWAQHEKRLMGFNDLGMLLKYNFQDKDMSGVRQTLHLLFSDTAKSGNHFEALRGNVKAHDLGYTSEQASAMALRYLTARGFPNFPGERDSFGNTPNDVQWGISRALATDALEKVFSLPSGSLSQLAAYDKYGMNDSNVDFVNLYTSLDNKKTLGMTGGAKFRSNEFLSYQLQLLEGQKKWMLNPNTEFASRQILAAQDVYGNSLDSRGIQAIQRMNDAVTNPQDEMIKVLTYDVIQQLFPQTRGNMMAIIQKQFSNNSEDRAKIQQAMFKKITEIYGEANTINGYSALSYYTGIKNPTELLGWSKRMQEGYPTVDKGGVRSYVNEITEHNYMDKTSVEMIKFTNETITQIMSKLGDLELISDYMLGDFRDQIDEIATSVRSSLGRN